MTGEIELLYSLTVPCVEESWTALKSLCEAFISGSDSVSEETALIMRLSVTEACRLALSQDHVCGSDPAIVTLRILQSKSDSVDEMENLVLEIEDPGPGLKIDAQLPPYPVNMHGRFYSIYEILGQNIMAKVEDNNTVSVHCLDQVSIENLSREHQIKKVEDKGLGLLAISKTWKSVTFRWDNETGSVLTLKKPALEVQS